MSTPEDKRLKCATCGHYKFLHTGNFKQECDACDDPSIPMDQRCPSFADPLATPKEST